MSNLFENVGRFLFSRENVRSLEKRLRSAGISMPADSFAGYLGLNVFALFIIIFALLLFAQPVQDLISSYSQSTGLPSFIFQIFLLLFSFILSYGTITSILSAYLLMKAEDRKNKVEDVLADYLTLVASNMKAGMTLDQSMWYSAKPEFGILSQEVKKVLKGSFSGETLEATLDRLADSFDSHVFKRTITLLKQSAASGGELTKVLENTADDVRNTQIMRKEVSASLILYEIFVLFAATVGTPFLFAVASRLISVFENIAPQQNYSVATGPFSALGGLGLTKPILSSEDFFWFTIPAIFITALISSFMVSVIRTGNKSQGMKYFPFVLVLSYIIYFVVIEVVDSFFSIIG